MEIARRNESGGKPDVPYVGDDSRENLPPPSRGGNFDLRASYREARRKLKGEQKDGGKVSSEGGRID